MVSDSQSSGGSDTTMTFNTAPAIIRGSKACSAASADSPDINSEEIEHFTLAEEKEYCQERLENERESLYDYLRELDTEPVFFDIQAVDAAIILAKGHLKACIIILQDKIAAIEGIRKQATVHFCHVPPGIDAILDQMEESINIARRDLQDAKISVAEKINERQDAIDERERHEKYNSHLLERIRKCKERITHEESTLEIFNMMERLEKAGFKGLRRAPREELKKVYDLLKSFDVEG